MAFQKMKGTEVSLNQMNIITTGTYIEGTVETKGSVKIDGKVKGIIKAGDDVRVGRSGEIVGEIYAKTAFIAGKVEGNIYVSQKLNLQESSTLNGNLSAGKLIIDEGAFFSGNSEMGSKTGSGNNGINVHKILEDASTAEEVVHESTKKSIE